MQRLKGREERRSESTGIRRLVVTGLKNLARSSRRRSKSTSTSAVRIAARGLRKKILLLPV
jgi:hypothetical protein